MGHGKTFKNTEGEIISDDGIGRSVFLSWLGLYTAGGTLFRKFEYIASVINIIIRLRILKHNLIIPRIVKD